jgi:hypothetical protein
MIVQCALPQSYVVYRLCCDILDYVMYISPVFVGVNFHISPSCNEIFLLQIAIFLFIESLCSQKFHNTTFAILLDMHSNYMSKSHPLEITKSLKKRLYWSHFCASFTIFSMHMGPTSWNTQYMESPQNHYLRNYECWAVFIFLWKWSVPVLGVDFKNRFNSLKKKNPIPRIALVFRILKKIGISNFRVSDSHRILNYWFARTIFTSRFAHIIIFCHIFTLHFFFGFLCFLFYNQHFFLWHETQFNSKI